MLKLLLHICLYLLASRDKVPGIGKKRKKILTGVYQDKTIAVHLLLDHMLQQPIKYRLYYNEEKCSFHSLSHFQFLAQTNSRQDEREKEKKGVHEQNMQSLNNLNNKN